VFHPVKSVDFDDRSAVKPEFIDLEGILSRSGVAVAGAGVRAMFMANLWASLSRTGATTFLLAQEMAVERHSGKNVETPINTGRSGGRAGNRDHLPLNPYFENVNYTRG
jgi:hypothetical protein